MANRYDDERQRVISRENAWAEAVARVWRGDEDFKKQLLADPVNTLKALGASLPDDIKVTVVEAQSGEMHFVLPPKPKDLSQFDDGGIRMLGGACPCTVCSTGGGGVSGE